MIGELQAGDGIEVDFGVGASHWAAEKMKSVINALSFAIDIQTHGNFQSCMGSSCAKGKQWQTPDAGDDLLVN